jgi:peptidoglycan/xylan/chitin deacetylase (PgdA/CDA1 family)
MKIITKIVNIITCKWMKLRLQPIRVFCLHHVCGEFDVNSMYACDWMQIDEFKSEVLALQRDGMKFISLSEAYNKITNDKWRNNKYVVLTFDDGYASLKEVLPWLEEQKIPATLFINGKYLDGKSYRNNPNEKYLTKEELCKLTSPLIEIGNHGWEHIRVTEMSENEFRTSVGLNVQLLSTHPNYIPFWAYTYGTHTGFTDSYLLEHHIVPVYIDGVKNYKEKKVIHRELFK